MCFAQILKYGRINKKNKGKKQHFLSNKANSQLSKVLDEELKNFSSKVKQF